MQPAHRRVVGHPNLCAETRKLFERGQLGRACECRGQDAKRLSDKAGLPIETVVGLLQDSDGRIKLKLPIEGSLLEPDIDVSSAINKAVGKTLRRPEAACAPGSQGESALEPKSIRLARDGQDAPGGG